MTYFQTPGLRKRRIVLLEINCFISAEIHIYIDYLTGTIEETLSTGICDAMVQLLFFYQSMMCDPLHTERSGGGDYQISDICG